MAAKNISLRKGLSKKEAYLLSSLSEKKREIFEIKDIIEELDCTYDYAKVIANRLQKKKWTLTLKKGKYLIVPLVAGKESLYTEHEFVIASGLVNPYYIAYRSALNYHGMTEQVPLTVFIATPKRTKNRKIHSVNYKFITMPANKFFACIETSISANKVYISDKEKTIADCLDRPQYAGNMTEVAKALWNAKDEIDLEKLTDYAIKMNNGAIFKRLGYLIKKLEINIPDNLDKKIRHNITKGYTLLDPSKKGTGTYSTEWRLIINVNDKELLEWMVIH